MKYVSIAVLSLLAGCCSHSCRSEAARSQPMAVAPVTSTQRAARPATKPQTTEYARRETVSFEADDADLRDVIDTISRQAGVNIVLEPNIHEKVTLTLRDVPWMEAVQLLAQRTRCDVNLLRDGVYYVIEPPRVTIRTE